MHDGETHDEQHDDRVKPALGQLPSRRASRMHGRKAAGKVAAAAGPAGAAEVSSRADEKPRRADESRRCAMSVAQRPGLVRGV